MSPYALQFTKCCNVSYLTGNWSKMWAQELQQTNQGLTLRVLLVCLSCGEACLYLPVTSSKGGRIELPATNVPNWAEKQQVRENEASRQNDRNKRHVWYAGAAAAAAKSCQSCLTLCDPTEGSPPGSSVPGMLQARTLEWVAISFSNMLELVVPKSSSPCPFYLGLHVLMKTTKTYSNNIADGNVLDASCEPGIVPSSSHLFCKMSCQARKGLATVQLISHGIEFLPSQQLRTVSQLGSSTRYLV